MKKLILVTTILFVLASCTNSQGNKVATNDAQAAANGEGQKLEVDVTASSIYWKGTKVGGMHDGNIALKDGQMTLGEGNKITAGTFNIDMNAMTSIDFKDDEKMSGMLLGHLKSADFFDVEKYPTSSFTITDISEAAAGGSATHNVSGNLKMKDVEKNITFGANITKEEVDGGVIYKAISVPFEIDRTDWNVQFGSKKLFPDLREMLVDENIQLQLTIVAKAI